MDVNLLRQLGLTELFEKDDYLFEVEDILNSVNLPMTNPWAVPPPARTASIPAAQHREKSLRGTLALAANILIYVLCAAVIAISLILKFGGYSDSILGYHIYHVKSGSMTPTPQADGIVPEGGFRKNDAIIVKNAAPETVEKGDVITFWQDDEHRELPITHRVVEVLDNGGSDIQFITKGDHNSVNDPEPVPGGRLIGVKILTLQKLGGVLAFTNAHPWITVGISAGVIAVMFTIFIVTAKRDAKKTEEQ